jgi:hypothetical protein
LKVGDGTADAAEERREVQSISLFVSSAHLCVLGGSALSTTEPQMNADERGDSGRR